MEKLTTTLKEELYASFKNTIYLEQVINALNNDDVNVLRVLLSDYLDEIKPVVKPIVGRADVENYNLQVTYYDKINTLYNSIMELLENNEEIIEEIIIKEDE